MKNRLALSVATILLLLLDMVGVTALGYQFRSIHSSEDVAFGISYSQKYAEELGLDWRHTYREVLGELGVRQVRLMSYWDRIEPEIDRLDFSELDWMFEQSAASNARVSLSIGLRQPRWPECHQPNWAKKLATEEFNQRLLNYLDKVVSRYRAHPALKSWQLENEASNQLFGACPKFNKSLYIKEFDLVKKLDQTHPIITTASNQSGFPIHKPVGDKIGFSIYNHATPKVFDRSYHWTYWYVPAWWHSFRAGVVEALFNTRAFVHELQAEPWGRVGTTDLSDREQLGLMSPEQLRENVDYAQRAGFKDIYLWGAEWWYWRLTTRNDPSLWQTAQSIFR